MTTIGTETWKQFLPSMQVDYRVMQQQIRDWCSARTNRIQDVWLEDNGVDGVALHVVSTSDQFDFELNQELADLVASLPVSIAIHGVLLPFGLAPDRKTFGVKNNVQHCWGTGNAHRC